MSRRILLMLVLSACSEAHQGRASTHPAEPDASEQSSPAATEDRAPDRDVATGASPSDVDVDASLGTTPESERGEYDASCPVHGVDVRGESQFGSLHVTEVRVEYWAGFTMGTTLLVRGNVAGRPIEIQIRVYALKYPTMMVPVGEYRSSEDPALSGDMSVFARFCDDSWTQCASTSTDLRKAVLRVDAHEVPELVRINTPVRFEGRLHIADPGWSLDLPFNLRWACGTGVDL